MPGSTPLVNSNLRSHRELLDSRQPQAIRLRKLAAEATTEAVRRQLEERALAEERLVEKAPDSDHDPG